MGWMVVCEQARAMLPAMTSFSVFSGFLGLLLLLQLGLSCCCGLLLELLVDTDTDAGCRLAQEEVAAKGGGLLLRPWWCRFAWQYTSTQAQEVISWCVCVCVTV